ncbi:hypothetical protein AGMMS4957_03230 [Bacteroidia bacterium]|nr:hypothetical protein AGMMS4957_03230 [Bacteroidia bacterium]
MKTDIKSIIAALLAIPCILLIGSLENAWGQQKKLTGTSNNFIKKGDVMTRGLVMAPGTWEEIGNTIEWDKPYMVMTFEQREPGVRQVVVASQTLLAAANSGVKYDGVEYFRVYAYYSPTDMVLFRIGLFAFVSLQHLTGQELMVDYLPLFPSVSVLILNN